MLIAVINKSTLVSDAQLKIICDAMQIQLNLHILPAWNMKSATVQFYSNANAVPGYSWILNVIDNDASVADALGYHDEESDKVVGYVMAAPILQNGGTVLEFDASNPSQYTVSATISHEISEMVGDRFSGAFSTGPQTSSGNLYCQELADPVENNSYSIMVDGYNVSVSNFIFPSWFNPNATLANNAPFDYLKKLTAPFTMDAGGYMLVATLSNEGQITAQRIIDDKMPNWRRAMKEHKLSRSSRRIKK